MCQGENTIILTFDIDDQKPTSMLASKCTHDAYLSGNLLRTSRYSIHSKSPFKKLFDFRQGRF